MKTQFENGIISFFQKTPNNDSIHFQRGKYFALNYLWHNTLKIDTNSLFIFNKMYNDILKGKDIKMSGAEVIRQSIKTIN